MLYSVDKIEDEWCKEFGEEQYVVLCQVVIEWVWMGELFDEECVGFYMCGVCNVELFKSGIKFDFGCGWLSFYEFICFDVVELIEDMSFGMVCIEVCCVNCGLYLGYVFFDGFGMFIGDCYCMNLIVLNFIFDVL